MNNFKKVNCINPKKEAWKYLKYYTFPKVIIENLREKYPEQKHQNNLTKQAKQISFSIKQAEEYFIAANSIDLSTKPLLLYYGAVSLSNALVMFKNDGKYSFDRRRSEDKHQHHGLELKKNFKNSILQLPIEEILESLACSIFKKDKDTPWGQFPLFYRSLTTPVYNYIQKLSFKDQNSDFIKNMLQKCVNEKDILKSTQPYNLLFLMKNIPELINDLSIVGIVSSLAKGELHSTIYDHVFPNGSTEKCETYDFFIHNIAEKTKIDYLKYLNEKIPNLKTVSDLSNHLHLKHNAFLYENSNSGIKYLPDIVDDANGKLYYILKPEEYIPEPASQYIILYILGTICRYHPDIWMQLIEENQILAELLRYVLNIIEIKFPKSILDQITNTKHIFV